MLKVNNASIYFETAGSGQPIVMIHAGVADSRQWNNDRIAKPSGCRATFDSYRVFNGRRTGIGLRINASR